VSAHSLYLHIPFCTTKCTYCAFNTYINLEALIPAYVEALAEEIRVSGQSAPDTLVHTVFFGGGTPSLLSVAQFEVLLSALRQSFKLDDAAEISIEANPNDLSYPYLADLRSIGINRLSVGMQSAVEGELKLYARRHDHAVVQRVMPEIRRAGFERVNIDLMYGGPYQTLETWAYTLSQTIALDPDHISLYALGLEEGTPLLEWVEQHRVPQPDDDLMADMYDMATSRLAEAGYGQYEISNWSRSGQECRHNLQYWRNEPYIGLGAGAHGWAGGVRYATELAPQRYVRLMQEGRGLPYAFPRTPATRDEVTVERSDEIAETLMMWLRLTEEGVVRQRFAERFGQDILEVHPTVLHHFEARGLIEMTQERVRLTPQGRLLSNVVFRELV
jgi:oxygen-independent coproporphyrinogen-3 oxidase